MVQLSLVAVANPLGTCVAWREANGVPGMHSGLWPRATCSSHAVATGSGGTGRLSAVR